MVIQKIKFYIFHLMVSQFSYVYLNVMDLFSSYLKSNLKVNKMLETKTNIKFGEEIVTSELTTISKSKIDFEIDPSDPNYNFTDWDNFNGSDWIATRQNCHNFGDITVITHNSIPTLKLFIAKEISEMFGYTQTKNLTDLIGTENFKVRNQRNLNEIDDLVKVIDFEIPPRGISLINYAGFNYAIMHSTKPNAKLVQKWVYGKILEIQKIGVNLKNIANNLEKIDYLPNNRYITVENGVPYTTSIIISQFFDIRHKNLLQTIDNKINSLLNLDSEMINDLFGIVNLNEKSAELRSSKIDDTFDGTLKEKDLILSPTQIDDTLANDVNSNIKNFINDNFILSEYIGKNNKINRQYKLTEQGFSFIVMGLTGIKADIYKIAFVKSFYEMRKIVQDRLKSTYLRKAFPNKINGDQFVYIIKNPFTNFIKIGISKHVDKRVKELETGAGCELELVYTSMLCTNSREIESELHKRYKHLNKFKEWFSINNIQEVIDYIENNVKVELTSDFNELKKLCDQTKFNFFN